MHSRLSKKSSFFFSFFFFLVLATLAGWQEPLLATVRRWKLAWFGHGHEAWHPSLSPWLSLSVSVCLSVSTTMQGTVERIKTQTRETTKQPARQRQGLAGDDLIPRPPVVGRQRNSLEDDVCFFLPSRPPDESKRRGAEWVGEWVSAGWHRQADARWQLCWEIFSQCNVLCAAYFHHCRVFRDASGVTSAGRCSMAMWLRDLQSVQRAVWCSLLLQAGWNPCPCSTPVSRRSCDAPQWHRQIEEINWDTLIAAVNTKLLVPLTRELNLTILHKASSGHESWILHKASSTSDTTVESYTKLLVPLTRQLNFTQNF